ncbi:PAS domain-containing protein, partial [Hyalangium sp.]|uniref:PAS domain-containing protein n=1 Tax=Hyalangium sp. TaxID=2028555 RepID=UPI002D507460
MKIPPLLGEELERRIQGEGGGKPRHSVLRTQGPETLPELLPPGLTVVGDAGGPLEELVGLCQQLHARRDPSRTHVVLLTRRDSAELERLAQAGVDEFVAPPGEAWGARLMALERRLALEETRPRLVPEESLQALRTKLEQARDFLRNALEALPDAVFVKDREHRWVAVNSAFCRLLGLPAEQLLGKSDHDFLPAPQADMYWEQDNQVFRTGQPLETEQTYEDAEGTRLLSTKKAAFTGATGEPFLVVVIRDMTERRRLEVQLRQADRMASVGTLAGGV